MPQSPPHPIRESFAYIQNNVRCSVNSIPCAHYAAGQPLGIGTWNTVVITILEVTITAILCFQNRPTGIAYA